MDSARFPTANGDNAKLLTADAEIIAVAVVFPDFVPFGIPEILLFSVMEQTESLVQSFNYGMFIHKKTKRQA